jgi:hypothetical protein
MDCSFVLIHHTSKGNQSQKELTDVGAGAGAQSRATDTHVILRRHEESDAVVLEAAVRSWPPVPPRCLRWAFPVWMPADDLDSSALKKEGGKKARGGAEKEEAPSYDAPGFVARFVSEEPKSVARIQEDAEAEGVSSRRVRRLLDLAEEEGLIFRRLLGPRKMPGYATIAPPAEEQQEDRKRAAVENLIRENPELPTKDIVTRCGVSKQYVNRIRRELGCRE